MYDAICLASGGLDSMVCLHLLKRQGIKTLPVFVNYGQRNIDQELGSLRANIREQGFAEPIVIDISGFGKAIRSGLTDPKMKVLEEAFTPNRNMLFLLLGASVAFSKGVSAIVLGFLSEETAIFPDQTDRFLGAAEIAIGESLGVSMRIFCPLRDMMKSNVVDLARELGVRHSYSCHSGNAQPCGRCIACLEYSKGD